MNTNFSVRKSCQKTANTGRLTAIMQFLMRLGLAFRGYRESEEVCIVVSIYWRVGIGQLKSSPRYNNQDQAYAPPRTKSWLRHWTRQQVLPTDVNHRRPR